jgi:hypothetical protein
MSRQRAYLLALAVRLLLFGVAFSLGAVREWLIVPAFGEPLAHLVGTLAFVAVLLGITAVFVRRIRPRCSLADLGLVGLLWPALTVAFEFLSFHFAAGKPWEVLLADYNLLRGRISVLVPLAELLGPPVSGWLMRPPPDRQASKGSGS